MATYQWRRNGEQDAYRILHEQGLDALFDFAGNTPLTNHMLCDWHAAGIARIIHTETGGIRIRTYAKYAGRS